jgi:hypothetical protein
MKVTQYFEFNDGIVLLRASTTPPASSAMRFSIPMSVVIFGLRSCRSND